MPDSWIGGGGGYTTEETNQRGFEGNIRVVLELEEHPTRLAYEVA
jgi:hypothetical protein